MAWFCVHEGTPQDTKLAVIAKKADAPRGTVLAIWIWLLDAASRNPERGRLSLEGLNEEIAISLDYDESMVARIVAAMRDKKMVDADGNISAWHRRQYQPETSTERTRRYRDRKRQERSGDAGTSQPSRERHSRHGDVRTGTDIHTDIQTKRENQQRNTESDAARADPAPVVASLPESDGIRLKAQASLAYIRVFDDAIAKHWGEERRRPFPNGKDVWQAGQWLDAGIPVAVVEIVADTHFAKLRAEKEQPPSALKYLDLMVRRAEEERTKPRVNGKRTTVLEVATKPGLPNDSPELGDAVWRPRVERWKKRAETWHHSYGPPPDSPMTNCPKSVLAEFNIINHEPRAAS